jgi:hypothetical protein
MRLYAGPGQAGTAERMLAPALKPVSLGLGASDQPPFSYPFSYTDVCWKEQKLLLAVQSRTTNSEQSYDSGSPRLIVAITF